MIERPFHYVSSTSCAFNMINTAFHPWKVTVPAARKKALFSGFPIGCCDHNTLCLTIIRGYSSMMERDPEVRKVHMQT
jgi:hypothetical protein